VEGYLGMIITSYTYSQLLTKLDSGPNSRSKGIVTHYNSAVNEDTLVFATISKSKGRAGRTYYQYVKFTELPDKMLSNREMKKFLAGVDIKLFCTCPAFKYYCAYTANRMKALQDSPDGSAINTSTPTIREPQGPACKHLANVLRILPFNWNKVIKDLGAFMEDRIIDEVYDADKESSFSSLDIVEI